MGNETGTGTTIFECLKLRNKRQRAVGAAEIFAKNCFHGNFHPAKATGTWGRAIHQIDFLDSRGTAFFGLGRQSMVLRRFRNMNPSAESPGRCRDIRETLVSRRLPCKSTGDTLIWILPLSPARRSYFDPCHRPRVSKWFRITNPRDQRVSNSRDILDSRGHTCWSREETLIGNRLLQRWSDFGLGRRSRVSR